MASQGNVIVDCAETVYGDESFKIKMALEGLEGYAIGLAVQMPVHSQVRFRKGYFGVSNPMTPSKRLKSFNNALVLCFRARYERSSGDPYARCIRSPDLLGAGLFDGFGPASPTYSWSQRGEAEYNRNKENTSDCPFLKVKTD